MDKFKSRFKEYKNKFTKEEWERKVKKYAIILEILDRPEEERTEQDKFMLKNFSDYFDTSKK